MKLKTLLAGASLAVSFGCELGTSCIAAGARIRTPRGLKRIEELVIGDEVWCIDPETTKACAGAITQIRTALRECVRLHYAGRDLTCTSDHPLYCPATKEWAPAGDWVLGKRVELLRVEEEELVRVRVERVETFAGVRPVFDLSVDHPLHNFVADEVLVHNKTIAPPSCRAGDGGVVQGEPCQCMTGGTGVTECSGSTPVCSLCSEPDGGSPDAG